MRIRTKLIIAASLVLLGLGVSYYWRYVRPAVAADKVFREGLRLYEEAKAEHGGEFNSKYRACLARLSATLQESPRRVPSANRVRAVEILGAIGEKYWEDEGGLWEFLPPGFPVTSPVVEVLGKVQRDQDVAVRRAAVQALARTGVANAAEPLIAALKDTDDAVRHNAVFALATLCNATPFDRSEGGTIGRSYDLRGPLQGAERAIDQALCATLQDGDPAMRERAAVALGQFSWQHLPRDLALLRETALREAVKDDLIAVRIYAYRALYRLSWRTLKDDDPQRDVLRTEAVELLAKALEHEDGTVRYRAADALRGFHSAKAVSPLVRTLQHDYQPVRLAAAQALHAMAERHAGVWGDEASRTAAAQALDEIGDRASIAALTAALGDRDSGVRCAVAEALSAVGRPVIAALQEGKRCQEPLLARQGQFCRLVTWDDRNELPTEAWFTTY